MREKARFQVALLVAIAMLAWQGVLYAEQGRTGDAAVLLGHEGLGLYQAGSWDEAFAHFKAANDTMYSPVFELYMARCLRNLNRLREASDQLEALLAREPMPAAPVSWHNALRDARAELEALRTRIPSLRIANEGLTGATVDDLRVRPGDLVRLNPGEHVVRGFSLDGQSVERRVLLSEGQQDVAVTLAFAPEGSPRGAPAPQVLALPATPAAQPRADHSWRTASYITGGIAVAAAIAGTVTGLLAKSKIDSIRAHCDGSHCPPELEDAAESARQLANVSSVAFGIAGIDLGFSMTFLLLPPGTTTP